MSRSIPCSPRETKQLKVGTESVVVVPDMGCRVVDFSEDAFVFGCGFFLSASGVRFIGDFALHACGHEVLQM